MVINQNQIQQHQLHIPIEAGTILEGFLTVPKQAKALIIFVHGSGSSRFSSRNQYVASVLQKNKFATLLMDLLTQEEHDIDAISGKLRFDIALLTKRIVVATQWLRRYSETKKMIAGYFGASTGAAAALAAAALLPRKIFAVVSRGGRPDLAIQSLNKVKVPVLFLVGENDTNVLEMNKDAYIKLVVEKKLIIIPGATHLFEEEGSLEIVASNAAEWFNMHLPK